jgi:hypothetical protein
MDKRFQVFVSSTFTDLVQERQAVLSAILEISHMPAGMELFPAGDDSAWRLIQDVIESSDYYVLIIGGRYGSLDEAGLGFTEKEYDYAASLKKPVIPFLHADPDNLPRGKTEVDVAAWEKLKRFRAKVEKRHTCVYWQSAEDLKAKVIVGMTATMRRMPAVGWVRADKVPADATVSDILRLRSRIAELEAQMQADTSKPPKGTEHLAQGEETHEIPVAFIARDPKDTPYGHPNDLTYAASVSPTWDEMFAAIAPVMINEATDRQVRSEFKDYIRRRILDDYAGDKKLRGQLLVSPSVKDEEVDTCLIQFRALGLIRENQKTRSVKDTQTYWTLTPYGDSIMTQLRAIKREAVD